MLLKAKDIKTLEQYVTALLTAMISLQSLEGYEVEALSKGFLQSDEEETSKSICWELRRLMTLYTKQCEQVLERAPMDTAKVITELQAMIKPKRRKKDDEGKC